MYCLKTLDKIRIISLRLRSLIDSEATFQMVEIDPGFICLSVPFMWTARVKQSVWKCSEHMPNVPVASWRHFRDCKHQKSSLKTSHLSQIAYKISHDVLPRCEYDVTSYLLDWCQLVCDTLSDFFNRVMADGQNQETRSK